ncbi:hypothetical protein [Leuconostoc gasicomitatum]|uniref:hypothetical protein n=1 Tax=Leuconostoc gasicomitatum TaxID=115778 RepID=UPI001CC5450C|nr:hypothetical protein [Leuconostoc gasicomitatum]MBZ5968861.1 hypothetical protein [Leuconostoc gasicomitatum]
MKINYALNHSYAIWKSLSFFVLLAMYLLMVVVPLLIKLSGVSYEKQYDYHIKIFSAIIVILAIAEIIFTVLLNNAYHKIISPLINNYQHKGTDYINDVIKFRSGVTTSIDVQIILTIVLVLASVVLLISPSILFKYAEQEKLAYFPIALIGAMIFYYFSVDQYLDIVYWKYYPTEYIGWMHHVLK